MGAANDAHREPRRRAGGAPRRAPGVPGPPGNPGVEPGFYRLAPLVVSFPFASLASWAPPSAPGAPAGMEDRPRASVASLPGPARPPPAVNPSVVVLAFTAASYANG